MNKTTSKDMMEREFEILKSVQGLQPPVELFDRIKAQTTDLNLHVSKKWFAGAAAVLALLLCIEVFLLNQSSTSKNQSELENLVQTENYSLYE